MLEQATAEPATSPRAPRAPARGGNARPGAVTIERAAAPRPVARMAAIGRRAYGPHMNLRRLATMTVAGLLTVPACAGHPVPAHGAGSRLSAGRPQDPAPQAIPVAAATLPARGTPPTGPVVFADLAGKWRGVMNEGTPGEVRSEIEVARLPSGDYVGRVSVPQQGVVLRATSVNASAGVLRFELKQVSGTFEGRL